MDKKEVKEIIDSYFPPYKYIPYVYTYGVGVPRNGFPTRIINSVISEHLDKEFRKTSNPIEIYYFVNEDSINYTSVIVQYNKNKTLVEIYRANAGIEYFVKNTVKHKHIRVKDIRDTTDLKYYLEGEKQFYDELQRAYEYKLKEIKRKQRMYDIAADDFEINIQEWIDNLNGYEFVEELPVYHFNDEDIKIKNIRFSLKHKNVLLHFESEFTLDYKIDTKLLAVDTFDNEELSSYKAISTTTMRTFERLSKLNSQQILYEASVKQYTQESLDKLVSFYKKLYKYAKTGKL